jgi:hypothetical protein
MKKILYPIFFILIVTAIYYYIKSIPVQSLPADNNKTEEDWQDTNSSQSSNVMYNATVEISQDGSRMIIRAKRLELKQ